MPVLKRLQTLARSLKKELGYYRLLYQHKGTPGAAKLLLWLALGYIMLPFDLIPDFIPVIGHLDDVIIVPLLLILAVKLIPVPVREECRARIITAGKEENP